jgi:hypothetical protein
MRAAWWSRAMDVLKTLAVRLRHKPQPQPSPQPAPEPQPMCVHVPHDSFTPCPGLTEINA